MAIRIEQRYQDCGRRTRSRWRSPAARAECAGGAGQGRRRDRHREGLELYVCGNGGIKPGTPTFWRKTLMTRFIKFIDRFLMLYIRTGDRL